MDDVVFLSRLQFGLTIGFHYIFPVLSIGLGLILVVTEGIYLKTKNKLWEEITRFWVRIFGLIFALGVATGIVMEFQFGTNWAVYSRFVGDVFGSALAAEGIFAFFLESGFLAILLFGWEKVKPRTHFLATVLVAAGAHFSAIWIVVANSWQQTPAGHRIAEYAGGLRAETVDFSQVIFNPSFIDRITHVILGCWQAGVFLVLSVSAWYLLRGKFRHHAIGAMKVAIVIGVIASILQLVTGHSSANVVAEYQPSKLAAFEGHYPASAPADSYLFGWVDEESETVYGPRIPGFLSVLIHWDADAPVTGLRAFPKEDRPPVNATFQSYHLMVGIGLLLIALSLAAAWFWRKNSLWDKRWFLWILVFSVLLPQIANQSGWFTAEVGRQPWIVYGLLRTSDAVSKSIDTTDVWGSLIMFGLIYLLLGALFVYLLNDKIQHGPDTTGDEPPPGDQPVFAKEGPRA